MDLARLSTASKILLGAGVLLFIDLFLKWQQICVGAGAFHVCGSRSGWHGVGIVVGLLTIALIVWEAIRLANVEIPDFGVAPALVSAALAAGVLVFTIIKFLADNESRHWPAWLGLLLAIIIGVGGWLRWQERDADVVGARPGGTTAGGMGTPGGGLGGTTGTTGTTTGGMGEPPDAPPPAAPPPPGGTMGGGTTGTTGEGTETTPPA
jgi:hypothetical protein